MKKNPEICEGCPLRGRVSVWGEGDYASEIVVVGQSPGSQEVKFHRPFIGPAGIRLNQFLNDAGLVREKLWLTNVIKCFLPAKSTVPVDAAIHCRRYLVDELANRKLVICVGTVAGDHVFELVKDRMIVDGLIYRRIVHPAATFYDKGAYYSMMLNGQAVSLKRELDEWTRTGLLTQQYI